MEFNTWCECGTLPTAHVSSEQTRQQHVEQEENIIEMVQRSPTSITHGPSTRLGVALTRVWRTLHEDGLYPFHPKRVQNLRPKDRLCARNIVTGYIQIANFFR